MNTLEGGCKLPIGVYTELNDESLHMTGQVWNLDGTKTVRESIEGTTYDILGKELAIKMLENGAKEILTSIRLH